MNLGTEQNVGNENVLLCLKSQSSQASCWFCILLNFDAHLIEKSRDEMGFFDDII